MFIYTGIAFWTSFVVGFLVSYCYKNSKKYINLEKDLSLTEHKFIDENNKCYIYKLSDTDCN
jgi:hypothetical protein